MSKCKPDSRSRQQDKLDLLHCQNKLIITDGCYTLLCYIIILKKIYEYFYILLHTLMYKSDIKVLILLPFVKIFLIYKCFERKNYLGELFNAYLHSCYQTYSVSLSL